MEHMYEDSMDRKGTASRKDKATNVKRWKIMGPIIMLGFTPKLLFTLLLLKRFDSALIAKRIACDKVTSFVSLICIGILYNEWFEEMTYISGSIMYSNVESWHFFTFVQMKFLLFYLASFFAVS